MEKEIALPDWAKLSEADSEKQALAKKLRLKYLLDPVFAFFLLILSSPLILLAALLIKWDGFRRPENAGSVFYPEPRISAGRLFRIYKFRTVSRKTVDWLKADPETRSITSGGDPTWSGRIILNWYLDELPQLINIARREMSFVGLRPHILQQTKEEIEEGFTYRLKMKAGFFGVPQACKRDPKYQSIMERMARMHKPEKEVLNTLDNLYVRKVKELSPLRLFFFDLYITARCFLVILRGGGVPNEPNS